MAAFRFFVAFAFLIACVLAIQAAEPEAAAPQQGAPVAPNEANRQKRFPFAYYGGYAAYHAPLAYSAYHAPLAYSAYHAPIAAYSYPYARSIYHAPYLY